MGKQKGALRRPFLFAESSKQVLGSCEFAYLISQNGEPAGRVVIGSGGKTTVFLEIPYAYDDCLLHGAQTIQRCARFRITKQCASS